MVASAALIAVGFAGSLVVGWQGSLLSRGTSAASSSDFGGIVDGLDALRPVAIAQAGLVVLIATPVTRVATSVAAFALEGDRLYTAITLGVLAILLGSLFLIR